MKKSTRFALTTAMVMGMGALSVSAAQPHALRAIEHAASVTFNGTNETHGTELVAKGRAYISVNSVVGTLRKAGYQAAWENGKLSMGPPKEKIVKSPNPPAKPIAIVDLPPTSVNIAPGQDGGSADAAIVRPFTDMFGNTDNGGFVCDSFSGTSNSSNGTPENANITVTYHLGGRYHWLTGIVVPGQNFSSSSTNTVYTNLASLTVSGDGHSLYSLPNITSSIGQPYNVKVDVAGVQNLTIKLQNGTGNPNGTNNFGPDYVGFVNVNLSK